MDSHVPVLRRVGIALLAYVGFRTLGLIVDFATGASHSVTIDLLSVILGVLLLRGSLGAARWVAFITAFELTVSAVAVVVGLPVALWLFRRQLWAQQPAAQVVWQLASVLLDAAFAFWVARELRDPAVEAALAAARRRSIARAQKWGVGFAVGLALLVTAVSVPLWMMWPRLTAPAVAAAEQQLGPGWEISVRSFTRGSRGWSAHVLARRGDEVRELDVGSNAGPQQP